MSCSVNISKTSKMKLTPFHAAAVMLLVMCSTFYDVTAKVYDLSHVHKKTTYTHPTVPKYNRTSTFKGMWSTGVFVEHGYFQTGEHSGTHIDAPNHFVDGGKAMEDITIDMTVADGVMIDCSAEGRQDASYEMPLQKLLDWEKENGRIPDRAAVIVNFGWSHKFENATAYRGSADSYEFPFVGEEAGMWLRSERDIKIIATDTLACDSMDPRQGEKFPIHVVYLPEDRLIIENLKDPGQLPPRGFRFFGIPVKYEGTTGTQIRAFAISSDEFANSGNSKVCPTLVQAGAVLVAAWMVYLRH